MTLQHPETIKCALCGVVSPQMLILSSSSFGTPDLDTRPPPMVRGTLLYWLQECPECGYAAADLSKAEQKAKIRQAMQSDAWKKLMPRRQVETQTKSGDHESHPMLEQIREI